MKKILSIGLFAGLAMFILTACGDSGSNSIVNRATNTAGSLSNTLGNAANMAANAGNSIANAVTGPSGPNDFLKEAAQGGLAEVELGQIAAKNAQNAEVKKFGQMMVADHTKANTELKALAAKKNVTIPANDMGKHQSTVDKMRNLQGADFDSAYVNNMVSDHETDVKEFQEQADKSTDPDVKAFAAKTLPVLKKHLEAIKAIQDKMKK